MRAHLRTVFDYFAYFSYAPSFSEIHIFFPKKISVEMLKRYLEKEVSDGSLIPLTHKRYFRASGSDVYTIPQYSIFTKKTINKDIQLYLKVLAALPLVRFVGVTGASAMNGYRAHDDLDLCIVTKKGFMWTTRFFVVLLAKLFGIHTRTGVCLNLFFDEYSLTIPLVKRNSYIAHELIQMKPIIDKDQMYKKFFYSNPWIIQYYPNIRMQVMQKKHNESHAAENSFFSMVTLIDRWFKWIQLPVIKRNKTSLFISPYQLWLFKRDFEKKLKRQGLVI